jgi:hypothetical protein
VVLSRDFGSVSRAKMAQRGVGLDEWGYIGKDFVIEYDVVM